jgi:hypothetical protein
VPESLRSEVRQYNLEFLCRRRAVQPALPVAVVAELSPCFACAAAAGLYDRAPFPTLPLRRCQRVEGCECWYAAVAVPGSARP